MTTITCDLCGQTIEGKRYAKVEFPDGTHPHNGSRLFTNADCCFDCIGELPSLECGKEFDEMKARLKR